MYSEDWRYFSSQRVSVAKTVTMSWHHIATRNDAQKGFTFLQDICVLDDWSCSRTDCHPWPTVTWFARHDWWVFRIPSRPTPNPNIPLTGMLSGAWCDQLARFMRPTWGPPGADRTQVAPMLAPWTLLSGCIILDIKIYFFITTTVSRGSARSHKTK